MCQIQVFVQCCYMSHQMSHSTIEIECYALVRADQRFQRHLMEKKLLVGDHQPRLYLSQFKVSNAHLMRCAMLLQPYRFCIVAIKSFENASADCLRRLYISISESWVYICLLTFFIDCGFFFSKIFKPSWNRNILICHDSCLVSD